MRPAPEFDDSARKVTYKIDVNEGPQYRMGGLTFKGLAERDAKALRNAWRMARGDVFDLGYFEDFFRKDARNAMQQIFEERREAGKPLPKMESKIAPNRTTLTVDVTIEMAN